MTNVPEQPGNTSNSDSRPLATVQVSDFDDPDPLHDNATDDEKLRYVTLTSEYGKEMLSSFQQTSFQGEDLWI